MSMHSLRRIRTLGKAWLLCLALAPLTAQGGTESPVPTPAPATESPAPAAAGEPTATNQPAGVVQPMAVIPRSVLLVCRFAAKADFTPAQKQLLFESLTMRLGSASPEVSIHEYPDFKLKGDADLNQLASLSGVDAWISVMVAGNMKAASIQTRAHGVKEARDFFVLEQQATIDPRFRNAFGGLWSGIEKKLAETIHQTRQSSLVTFRAPERTVVEIGTDQIVGAEGTVGFQVASPATYAWRAYLPGYRALSGTTFVDADTEIPVNPKPYFPMQIELGLEWLAYPTVRTLFNLKPDLLDLDIGLVFYNFGIMPSLPTDPQPSIFHDYHMVNLLFGLRWYPIRHRYELRPWLGGGFQVRFLTQPEFNIDQLSPAGFYLQLGFSLDIVPEMALFLELTPRITYSRDPLLASSNLVAEGHSNSGFNTTIHWQSWLIEPWHFIVGVRLQP